jgi:phage gpG-like protein
VAGVEGAIAKLVELGGRGPVIADLAVAAMSAVLERAVKDELSRSSHSRGTPTPAASGGPPSTVTGNLGRSVVVQVLGDGHARVGASASYARVQELGGGNNLPARPYLRPAYDASILEARQAALAVISVELLR